GRGTGHRLLAGDDAVTLRPLGDDPVAHGAGVQVHRGVSLEWLVYVGVPAVDAGVVGVFDLVSKLPPLPRGGLGRPARGGSCLRRVPNCAGPSGRRPPSIPPWQGGG